VDKLIIATSRKLIVWDGDATTFAETTAPWQYFYGITWEPGRLYAVFGGNVLTFTPTLIPGKDVPLGFGLSSPRQIFSVKGELYVCEETGHLWKWNRSTERTTLIKHFKKETCLNSIWNDGEFFYIVGSCGTNIPKMVAIYDGNWREQDRYLIDRDVFRDGMYSNIYNVYMERGIIYTLARGTLIQIDTRTGKTQSLFFSDKMCLRGLARTGHYFYVGVSDMALPENHTKGNSSIIVLDDDLDYVNTIELRGTGQLYDIRAIDSLDLAHNRIRCPIKGERWKR